DELLELGELEHGAEPAPGLLRRQAHHYSVEDDVLACGQLDVEADPELDEGSEAPGHPDRPRIGSVDTRQQLQQRALAGAVAADDAEELAPLDLEGDSVECAQFAEVARGERPHHPLFERVDAMGRDAERLLQALD